MHVQLELGSLILVVFEVLEALKLPFEAFDHLVANRVDGHLLPSILPLCFHLPILLHLPLDAFEIHLKVSHFILQLLLAALVLLLSHFLRL